jgi:hypothetical protein
MRTESQYNGKTLEHYDRDFYEWTIEQNLASPFDLWISDIDAMVRDRQGNFQLLEIKRNNYLPKPYQLRNMLLLNAIIERGMSVTGGMVSIDVNGKKERHKLTYHGFNLLQLSNVSFYESEFRFNQEEVNSEELRRLLSFE